jgi:hypothetical protein
VGLRPLLLRTNNQEKQNDEKDNEREHLLEERRMRRTLGRLSPCRRDEKFAEHVEEASKKYDVSNDHRRAKKSTLPLVYGARQRGVLGEGGASGVRSCAGGTNGTPVDEWSVAQSARG